MDAYVDFDHLQSRRCCLADASSVRSLLDVAPTLTCRLTKVAADAIVEAPTRYSLDAPLAVLERWIVTDTIVVDAVALDSLTGGQAARGFRWSPHAWLHGLSASELQLERWASFAAHFKAAVSFRSAATVATNPHDGYELLKYVDVATTVVPFDVASSCFKSLDRTAGAIRAAAPEVGWDSYGFGLDKPYADTLVQVYDDAASIASSNLGVERTLYYYEVAAAAGVPTALHPKRDPEVAAISRACRDALAAVRATLDAAFVVPLHEELSKAGLSWSTALPPLATMIVQQAGRHRTSIVEAARDIKESSHAREFRNWLGDLQVTLVDPSPQAAVRAARVLRQLRDVASRWLAELDLEAGVTYRRREIRLDWIPRIGALLGLLGDVSIRDPILGSKGYLAFVASWFSTRPDAF